MMSVMARKKERIFRFKRFSVVNERSAMKVGTDGVLLGAWCTVHGMDRILDVGTGCGVIALMLAQRAENAQIDGLEIDAEAADEARLNFASSEWGSRLLVQCADYKWFTNESKYDLIVSNPPFFSAGVLPTGNERTMARHTTELTFSDLIGKSAELLTEDGLLAIIVPADAETEIMYHAEKNGLRLKRICRVKGTPQSEPKRIMCEFSKSYPREIEENEIVIEYSPLNFTEEYIRLTKDFYLKM